MASTHHIDTAYERDLIDDETTEALIGELMTTAAP